jgi:protein-S-isoprenylcysteine O-methyltransferase Ste14
MSGAKNESMRGHLPAPLVFAGGYLAGLGLQWALPIAALEGAPRWIAGSAPVVVGLAIGLWARGLMVRRGTSPNPFKTPAALVIEGPYRWSRHPMYVSRVLIFGGIAILFRVTWALVLMPAVMALLYLRTMRSEERLMTELFGESYTAYRARVRPWL